MRGILDLRQVKRVALRAMSGSMIRNLRGFTKGHEVPSRVNSAAQKFVARLAAEDIEADLDRTYRAVREAFGFKRRQLEASSEGDAGYLRTPLFEYRMHAEIDLTDPSSIVWHREIAAIKDSTLLQRPEFGKLFGPTFDILVLEFRKPINVLKLIDRMEEVEKRCIRVVCPSDASWCEISVNGFRGAVRVESDVVRIEGRRAPPLPSLFDQFLRYLER